MIDDDGKTPESMEGSGSAAKESTGEPPEHYVFDSVVSREELLWIYHGLLNSDGWSLSRQSKRDRPLAMVPFMSFPGLVIETSTEVRHPFFSGYFHGLVFRLRKLAKEKYNLVLPSSVRRIHIGAKSSMSRTEFHVDTPESDVWTILGFLNPIWNTSDGGEFFLKDHKIQYKSGRFIVFRSNIEHNGGYVANETLNYWRVAANIMLDNNQYKKKNE